MGPLSKKPEEPAPEPVAAGPVTEDDRVRAHKAGLLMHMGFAEPDAHELAHAGADIHLVARLVKAGCDLATAARIVR